MTNYRSRLSGRRIIQGAAIAVAGCLSIAACGSSGSHASAAGSSSPGSYTIAELMDLTGSFAQPGIATNAGIQAYAKKVNAAGGVNGHKVVLQVVDTQSTDAGNVAGMQKVLSGSPLAILQNGNSSFPALLPLIRQSSTIPFLTAGESDTSLYPTPVSNVYMIQASAKQQATALVAEVKARLGSLRGKKVAFYGLEAPYIDDLLSVVKRELSAQGGSVGDTERFPVTAVSFSAQASNIAGTKPDAVIFVGDNPDSAAGLGGLVQAGISGPIVTYSSGSADSTLEAVKAANVYGLRTTAVPSAGTPMHQAATTLGYGSAAVDGNFSLGWAEMASVVAALQACGGNCSSSQLNAKLNSQSNYTPPSSALFGPITVSSSKHAMLSSGQYFAYVNGSVAASGDPVQLGS